MDEATLAAHPLGSTERRVLEALPERVMVCALDGRIAWANGLAESLLGRRSAEVEGRPLGELVRPEARIESGAPLLEHLLALPRGEGVGCVAVHRTGTHIRVELSATRLANDLAIAVLRHLPAHDVASGARVHPGTYELVFERAPVGIFYFDADGVITACNDAFVRMIGSSRRVLVGLHMDTLPDVAMKRSIRAALAGERGHFEGDYRSATADKVTSVRVEFAPILGESGHVLGGVAIAEDVTERKRTAEALQHSVDSLRGLIENAPDAISIQRGNRFLLVNRMLVRLLGYDSREQLMARSVEDVLHPAEIEALRAEMHEMAHAKEGHALPLREVRLRKKNGDIVTAEIATIAIHFEGGPAVFSLARDITERKALEARLAQADRLASVGTLAAGVAHEINNPLAYVMANLDLMARQLGKLRAEDEADRRFFEDALKHARDGCERVRLIVRDLRIFSRATEDRRAPVDVTAVVDSVLNMAAIELRNRARLVRRTPPVARVLGDEGRLGQVVLNLVLNAAQAIPAGAPADHTITISTADRGDMVEICVADTGVGIPAEMLGHIFEPFWTTKPVGVGTGLGLSIVHGIVQAYGGTIEVQSEPGVGSTFRVLLPAITTPRPESAPPPERSDARAARPERIAAPGRILLVDDEVRFGEALRSALSERHDVTLATSGREALGRLLAGEHFDLVVCDLMMPDLSGMAILDQVRRARPELMDRFVLMTGGAYTAEARAFFEHLTVPRLEKPFDVCEVERLLAAVQQHGTLGAQRT